MKYRMEKDEDTGCYQLLDGDEIIMPLTHGGLLMSVGEAAVEFCQEIEQLTAQRDELLAACRASYQCLTPPEGYRFKVPEAQTFLASAIARVEAGQGDNNGR